MRKRRLAIILAFPALAVVLFAVILPMLVLVAQSLNPYGSSEVISGDITLENYTRMLTTPFYLKAIARTLIVAGTVVVLTALVGFLLAVEFARCRGWRKATLSLIILSPLLVSVIIRNLGWVVILGHGGLLAWVAGVFGSTVATQSLLQTHVAIVIGLVHVMVPFMVLPIVAALQNMDDKTVSAARTLGASPLTVLRLIVLPAARPGCVAGCTLVYVLSASYFVTPALLGGPRIPMMSFLIFQSVVTSANMSFAAAVAIILLAMTTVVTYIAARQGRSSSVQADVE